MHARLTPAGASNTRFFLEGNRVSGAGRDAVDTAAPSSGLDRRARRDTVVLAVAATAPALLYLRWVIRYSSNVPIADDWNVVSVASHALHHSLSWQELWAQYADTRLLVPKVVFAGFGRYTHLDERAVILFSAVIFVATFGMLLVLFRSYLQRPLRALAVFALGIVWFSVADVQNALWSFQLAWYLVLFFFVAMCGFLLGRCRSPRLFLALAVLAAVLASLTEVQGFAVWAVGLVGLLWETPWSRRTAYDVAIWAGAAAITAAIYLNGFDTGSGKATCVVEGGNRAHCSTTFGLTHPVELAKFVTALAGNVVPTLPGQWVWAHQLLGAVMIAAAVFVVVQVFRERPVRRYPLPVLLIAFALQFDLMVALSRLGLGTTAAGVNRYTMPNLLLLCGIVMYAAAHARESPRATGKTSPDAILGIAAVVALVMVQAIVATDFGITYGRAQKRHAAEVARVFVNFRSIPFAQRDCFLAAAVVSGPRPGRADADVGPGTRRLIEQSLRATRDILIRDHLSLFHGDAARRYRAEGPPREAPVAWWHTGPTGTCETERPLGHGG
jgi:hypothetical protein